MKYQLLNMLYLGAIKYNQIYNSKEITFLKAETSDSF